MKVEKAPLESYADIGGLDKQVQEIKEAVELPLTRPELYEDVGIKPPKGVVLYGEPGTGKTLLAKAVANSTSATFLRVTGSEMVQKYLGEGPKLVREIFKVAEEHAPSIVFIDEIDAIGTKRVDSSSSGEREVQRTMLELLNQLDGFDERGDVKVIMATNRIESLDPALIRPGRIDRKIEFPLPDVKTKRMIFRIHTSRMGLAEGVDLEEFVMAKDELSGADIKAVCTEAGMLALRERRMKVTQDDFRKAKDKALYRKKGAWGELLRAVLKPRLALTPPPNAAQPTPPPRREPPRGALLVALLCRARARVFPSKILPSFSPPPLPHPYVPSASISERRSSPPAAAWGDCGDSGAPASSPRSESARRRPLRSPSAPLTRCTATGERAAGSGAGAAGSSSPPAPPKVSMPSACSKSI